MQKGGLFNAEPADDTWRAELTWRARPMRMRHGTEATWQGRTWPMRGAGDVRVAQTRGRRPRESTRMPVRGATWQRGTGSWRAHGLVGPGYRIGAVTHLCYAAPPYMMDIMWPISQSHFHQSCLCSLK